MQPQKPGCETVGLAYPFPINQLDQNNGSAYTNCAPVDPLQPTHPKQFSAAPSTDSQPLRFCEPVTAHSPSSIASAVDYHNESDHHTHRTYTTCPGSHYRGLGALCRWHAHRFSPRRQRSPLVMVHGSIATHTDWMAWPGCFPSVTPALPWIAADAHFGRGASPYSIEREYEDVCAVLEAAGPGAFLAGHSFGAICAMGAALLHPVPSW